VVPILQFIIMTVPILAYIGLEPVGRETDKAQAEFDQNLRKTLAKQTQK
jgi:hypothetical protein